jgi:hypothetical protein
VLTDFESGTKHGWKDSCSLISRNSHIQHQGSFDHSPWFDADHSYGIQVAQMAGLPRFVTSRAKEILANLESKELTPYEIKKEKLKKFAGAELNQISLFEFQDDKIRKEIGDLEINKLTPMEALNKLDELKRKIKEAILAYKMTKSFSKDQILELYLNQIYLGSGAYGVAAAAQVYFNISGSDSLILRQIVLISFVDNKKIKNISIDS